MVAATVYGVVQLLVLASPARSVRVSTVLLAVAVGVYGCGVGTALLELAYTRSTADLTGESLSKVVEVAGYTVDPVIEELIKLTPLLLVAWNVRVRRQWGLTDYVVIGSALGAGFGLLEAVARFGLDADRAIAHPAGGWAIPDSLRAPYIPGPEQVFSAWFPAPSGTLELGNFSPAAGTSPHLVYTALTALGVGVLVRGRGWVRALGLLPVATATSHHMLTNYAAARPADRDARSWVDAFDGTLWAIPLLCLAVAVAFDLRHIRRGKRLVPGILLQAERTGRSGLAALAGYGAWRVPWATLIALRFARMRRSLLYAAARPPYPGAEALHQTVAWAAGQIDASDNEHAWRRLDFRAVRKATGAVRDWRRMWFVLISLGLALPALVLICVGSFPAAATLQERFGSGNGPYILMAFGIAGLLWMGWQFLTLLNTWQTTRTIPHGEMLAATRFRIWTALGGLTTGAALLLRLRDGLEPDDPVIHNLHLLEALNNFLTYLGFALILVALLTLLPSGGGLALATAGAGGGIITVPAVIHAAAFGTLGIVLMSAGAAGGGGGAPESQGSGSSAESSGQGRVRRGKEYEDHLQQQLGGRGSFREGGREFDGAYLGDDGAEVWYEAKSGKYWDLANENPKVMEKFKSNLGDARRIAEEGGRRFSLISEKPIPENIAKWLNKKNYVWRVISKEAG